MNTAIHPAIDAHSAELTLKVVSVENLTPRIKKYELEAADGAELPPFEAGAHIEIQTGVGGDRPGRAYSLAGDPRDRSRYVTAVLREDGGGGGSKWMHDNVAVGDTVKATMPLNNFPLNKEAKEHVLIAGGVGITPLMAMGHELARGDKPFHLHYCTKAPEDTAFIEEVKALFGDRVTFHHDGGDPSKGLNLKEALAQQPPGAHLYICGPGGLLNAARDATKHWVRSTVHFELFSSARSEEEKAEIGARGNEEFEIVLQQSGMTLTVPADKTILEVLAENGIDIIKVCEEGYCGTCQVGLLGGKADHRDEVLDDDEKESNTLIQVCISRAKPGETLILDL